MFKKEHLPPHGHWPFLREHESWSPQFWVFLYTIVEYKSFPNESTWSVLKSEDSQKIEVPFCGAAGHRHVAWTLR